MRPQCLLAIVGISAVFAVPAVAEAQDEMRPTYSDSQAVRGRLWFQSACQSCHELTDMASADFKVKWGGRTAFDLFEIIATTMPQAEPGTLSARSYVDIVAYLMQLNGMPAGTTALSVQQAALASTRLTFTPHASPHASPHSTLRRL